MINAKQYSALSEWKSKAYIVCDQQCNQGNVRLFSGVCVISANSCVGAVDDGKCSL